jgi:phage-related protein
MTKMRKLLKFEGSSREDLLSFPKPAIIRMGYELGKVQDGQEPTDWKPFSDVGPGVREIRIEVSGDDFRSLYVVMLGSTVHVLHCFPKKSNKTRQADIDLAKKRYKALVKEMKK